MLKAIQEKSRNKKEDRMKKTIQLGLIFAYVMIAGFVGSSKLLMDEGDLTMVKIRLYLT